jgi:hypothetical protein
MLEPIFPMCFTNVTTLNLSYNSLKWREVVFLKDLPSLTTLMLVGNPIKKIGFPDGIPESQKASEDTAPAATEETKEATD